jgi:nucleotide-binding universal stress UspA family protein
MTDEISTEKSTKASAGLVVVGIDDSEPGRDALRTAGKIARQQNWTLLVVHTFQMMYPVAPFAIAPVDVELAGREASEAVTREIITEVLGAHPDIDVKTLVEQGPAGAVLVDASKNANLLVVGSRGRGGFASLTLGSVSSACVHHAHCPVLVLRSK